MAKKKRWRWIAILLVVALAGFAWMARTRRPSPDTLRLANALFVLYGAQLLLGSLNVVLKAPIWMQLTHLLVTNLIWMGLILLGASAMAKRESTVAGTTKSVGKFAPA